MCYRIVPVEYHPIELMLKKISGKFTVRAR